jgi:hypothetical protein
MTMQHAVAPVSTSITVAVPQARAFEFFTAGFNDWWPMDSHHIGEGEATAFLEPREGGRWFERNETGAESDWGYVIAWEPPGRVVLAWQLDADWEYDAGLVTEVEIRFTPEGENATRVELEHRHLERIGERAAEVREAGGSANGWTGLLKGYAEKVK